MKELKCTAIEEMGNEGLKYNINVSFIKIRKVFRGIREWGTKAKHYIRMEIQIKSCLKTTILIIFYYYRGIVDSYLTPYVT